MTQKAGIKNWVAILLMLVALSASASEKNRLIVLTDIGGDPDDQMSMVRLMTYANHMDIEALIATPRGWGRSHRNTSRKLSRPMGRSVITWNCMSPVIRRRIPAGMHFRRNSDRRYERRGRRKRLTRVGTVDQCCRPG